MAAAPSTSSVGETVFEVYRETGEENSLNRFCKEPGKEDIRYYCEADAAHHIQVHKGDKSGPVIASATQFLGKDGTTEVAVTASGANQSIQLQHVHNTIPFFHGNTFFQIGEKKVHWKGQSALVDDHTGVCLAVFKASFFGGKPGKLGTLLITAHGAEFTDLIVISALVEQERSDEAHRESKLYVKGAEERHFIMM